MSKLIIQIGAAMAGSFKTVVSGAKGEINTLGKSLRQMKAQQRDLGQLQKQRERITKLGLSYQTLQQRVDRTRTSLNKAGTTTQAQQAQLQTLSDKAQLAANKLTRETQALREQERHLKKAGLLTEQLAQEHDRLGDSIRDVTKRRRALNQHQQASQANLARRADLRGQIFDMVALGAAIGAPIRAAVQFESVMADVRKVVDFETPAQFKAMQTDVLKLSTVLPMSAQGLGDIMAAAGQAGIARHELTPFAEDAAKMGVAFDMSGDQAGAAMAGMRSIFNLSQTQVVSLGDAYNHLSNNMDATAADMINIGQRTGATAKLIGLTGEQLSALSATFLALKTPPEVAATGINALMLKLATAEQQTPKFQQALASMGLSATELKAAMEQDAQGALLSFLTTLRDSEDLMGTLTHLFGMEYADDIAKLVGGLDQYRDALSLVGDQTQYAGSMTEEYRVRSQTSANQLTLFRNQVNRLGVVLGAVLLPPLNQGLSMIGAGIDVVANLATTFPKVTTAVIGVTAGLVVLKITTMVGAYALTFLKGAVLKTTATYTTLKAGIIGTNIALAAQKLPLLGAAIATGTLAVKTKVATAAQWLWNAALTANPIGLVITAVGALATAAYVIYDQWQPIMAWLKEKFGWLGDAMGWISQQWQGLFGDDKDAKVSLGATQHPSRPQATATPVKALTAAAVTASALMATPAAALPPEMIKALATPVAATTKQTNVQHNPQYTIHLQQQPGEDAEQLAQRVMAQIQAQEQQKARGAFYDS